MKTITANLDSDEYSLTVGPVGPILLQGHYLSRTSAGNESPSDNREAPRAGRLRAMCAEHRLDPVIEVDRAEKLTRPRRGLGPERGSTG